jgi:hypothetical protein
VIMQLILERPCLARDFRENRNFVASHSFSTHAHQLYRYTCSIIANTEATYSHSHYIKMVDSMLACNISEGEF